MFPFSRFRWWGLRVKILVWSFIPTALALVAVGLISFYAFQSTTRYLLIERNRELVRVLAVQLSGSLDIFTGILSDLTHSQNFAVQNPAHQQAALSQASSSLVIFDGGVVATDPHGVVIAAQPERPDLIGEDWSSRPYFRQMLRAKQPTFSNIVTDGPEGARTIVIAVPITGPRDEFLGMAAGMFQLGASHLSTFYGNIVRLRIGANDEAHLNTYLVDGNGSVIYHTQYDRIGTDFSTRPPVRHILSGNFVDEFSGEVLPQQTFRGSAGAMRTLDAESQDVVAYFASIPGTSWGLVTESSWRGLLSYYRTYLLVQSGLFVLGILAPALLVGYRIQRITQPLYELKTAVEDVALGSFGRQVQINTHDELQELGEGFNHMSAQLSQSYAALKEREERLALVTRATHDGIWDWNLQTDEVYFSPRWKSMLGYEDHEIDDRFESWVALIHPDESAEVVAAIKNHIQYSHSTFHLEHRLRHKEGDYRWILTRGIMLVDEHGKPVRMVGSHSDITQRRRAEDELRKAYETLEERVKERTKHLAALNSISALVSRSLDIEQTFKDALARIVEITGVEHGVAYRLEGIQEGRWLTPEEMLGLDLESLFLNPLVSWGFSEKLIRTQGRLPLEASGIAACLDDDSPRIQEVGSDGANPRIQEMFQTARVEQIVSIPLQVKGRLIGVIQVGSCKRREFSPEEIDLLAAIGQQVGVFAENARLHEAVQQTATLEERARLARELHDSVTQSLYSVTLLAEAAARLLSSGDTHTAAEHLRELREAAQESLREMRLLIYELRPVAIEKSGLADALRLRLEAVESRSGIKTEISVQGTENLSFTIKSELYQIAQETLNNILKHSRADRVQVRLAFTDSLTRLEIQDDGIGFDPRQAAGSGGMGLSGLDERAEKIGAKLLLDSAPGKGTTVSVEVRTYHQAERN